MIRIKLFAALLLLAVSATPAQADIQFAIGEPASGATKSGIGQISGWAVSDVEIVSVEAFIDGMSLGVVPYGGTRQDVAAAFPDIPGSEFSGWAMKWNYSLLAIGDHQVTVTVTDAEGASLSKNAFFSTTAFQSEFISDRKQVVTSGATISSPEDGLIVITGAVIQGETVDIELSWDTPAQQFLISNILGDEPKPQNQVPTAEAGPNRSAEVGSMVTIEGDATDSDGSIVSYSWSQVSGSSVNLVNADQRIVEFVAPQQTGLIRLRLTVMDNNGAHGTDDTVIDILPPPPNPDPGNQPPTADAGSNRSVETNQSVQITGDGNDPDGSISSWKWERVSGLQISLQNTSTRTVTLTAAGVAGEVRLRLTVTDNDGATGTDDVTITVVAPEPPPPPPPSNQAPTANAGANRTVAPGENVAINGSGSDPDGTISGWSWSQVSGTTVTLNNANSQQVQFTAPQAAGDIKLRLTVTDNDGATDSDDVIITVDAPPAPDNTTGETLQSMLDDLNAARGQARKCGTINYPAQPPFKWSSSLASVAKLHSMDMARQGYFEHNSIDGTPWYDRVWPAWGGGTIGENIAAASNNRSDGAVVQMWLDSPPHCAGIMDPGFTHVGVGAGHNTENGYTYHHFWTLDFGG